LDRLFYLFRGYCDEIELYLCCFGDQFDATCFGDR